MGSGQTLQLPAAIRYKVGCGDVWLLLTPTPAGSAVWTEDAAAALQPALEDTRIFIVSTAPADGGGSTGSGQALQLTTARIYKASPNACIQLTRSAVS
jgi:hypothetical protein